MTGVAAVMLVKDEADIIESTVRHLLAEVDYVLVADNLSTDGTKEILDGIAAEDDRLAVEVDDVVGYYQSAKTTALSRKIWEMGFEWVVPVDADEIWYSPFGRVADVLEALPHGGVFASALIKNHITTNRDIKQIPDPTVRICWRIRDFGTLPKVACRTSADLAIGMGNHDAVSTGRVDSTTGGRIDEQLYIHHFPWRSEKQFVKKIRNGAVAYAMAPELNESHFGEHWRAFGMPTEPFFEERCKNWFRQWGFRAKPEQDASLIYEPAPVSR